MSEILENLLYNNSKKEKYPFLTNSDNFNDSELRKTILKEIADFAKSTDNEEAIKLYASVLIEKYLENMIENRFNDMLSKII